jgi:hypothetical protein
MGSDPFWSDAEQHLMAALSTLARKQGMDTSGQSLAMLLDMGKDELVKRGLEKTDWADMPQHLFNCIAAGLRSTLAA